MSWLDGSCWNDRYGRTAKISMDRNAKQGLVPKLRNRFGALPPPPPKKPQRSRALCPTNAKGLVGYPRGLAHQTYCDVSGQARPSRWRAGIGVRALEWRPSCAVACKLGDCEHAGNARVSNAKQGLVPKLRNRFGALPPPPPKKAPAFEGLVPDERNRFGRLTVLSNAPNLLRRAGTSPTIAGKHSNKTGMPSPNGGRSCWMPRKRSFWTRLKLDAIKNSREFE